MTLLEAAFVLLLMLLALSAVVGIVVVIPWCQRSQFRYRLWRLRDRITDDLINGVLPDSEVVHHLRDDVGAFIRYARQFTFVNFVLTYAVGRNSSLASFPRPGYEDLNSAQLERLRGYEHEFSVIRVSYLFKGSPSGWLGTLAFPIVLFFFGRTKTTGDGQRPKEFMEKKVCTEVVNQPAVWMRTRQASATASEPEPRLSAFV
jgi:hypothetical protein